MKKTLILFSAVLALAACNKVEPAVDVISPDAPVTFKVTVGNTDETKAVKSAWANGDKIYVFFEGMAEKWLELTYDGTTWNEAPGSAAFVADDFATLGTKELTAVHVPVSATVNYESSKFSFTDTAGNPIYTYYLYEANKSYTVSGTTVTLVLSLRKPENFVWFHVAGIQDDWDQYYLLGTNAYLMPTACDYVALTGGVTEKETDGHILVPTVDSDGAMYAAKGTEFGAGVTFSFHLVKVNNADDMIATRRYLYTTTNKHLISGHQVNLPALSSWTENKTVKLGFPSYDVYWATGNLSDTQEETGVGVGKGSIVEYNEYGKYYAWADVIGYSPVTYVHDFVESNAPYYDGSAYTKYDDVKLILEKGETGEAANDDAARYCLGGTSWRIPTVDELENLHNYGEWVTSPATGLKVTGPNGLCLFLPAAGYGVGTARWSKGSYGFYWSSVMRAGLNHEQARRLQFYSGGKNINEMKRCIGLSIRPVKGY